jgi:hypothetical protein
MNFEKGDLVEVRFYRDGAAADIKAVCLTVHPQKIHPSLGRMTAGSWITVLPIGEEKPLTVQQSRLTGFLQQPPSQKDPIAPKHPI